jgi:hypothetical protein
VFLFLVLWFGTEVNGVCVSFVVVVVVEFALGEERYYRFFVGLGFLGIGCLGIFMDQRLCSFVDVLMALLITVVLTRNHVDVDGLLLSVGDSEIG